MRAAWIALVLVAACGDKDEASGGDDKAGSAGVAKATEPTADSGPRKALVEAWDKAGLKAVDMKASTAFGKDCKAGTVNKVEVVVCDLGSADEAKKVADGAGLTWVGSTTGAAWASGQLAIAAADRKKADANGKTINQLMKSTPK